MKYLYLLHFRKCIRYGFTFLYNFICIVFFSMDLWNIYINLMDLVDDVKIFVFAIYKANLHMYNL